MQRCSTSKHPGSGEIWKAWFGPGSEAPMRRTFSIRADY